MFERLLYTPPCRWLPGSPGFNLFNPLRPSSRYIEAGEYRKESFCYTWGWFLSDPDGIIVDHITLITIRNGFLGRILRAHYNTKGRLLSRCSKWLNAGLIGYYWGSFTLGNEALINNQKTTNKTRWATKSIVPEAKWAESGGRWIKVYV